MKENNEKTSRRDWMDTPLMRSKISSANVKFFPEAGLGYFVGPFLAFLSNAILGGYLNRYYTDVLGLTKWASTFAILMPIISAVIVILGNLFVGRLMDKFSTSQGKARPLMLLSAPLLAIALCLLFLTPLKPDSAGTSVITLVWIAVSYNLYYSFAYPFYYASHSALVSLSTRSSKHRGLLAVCSNAAGVAAVGFGCNIVFPLFQSFLFKTDATTNSVIAESSYVAWRYFMIGLVVVTFIGIMIEYFFTRERVTEESSRSSAKQKKVSMGRQFKSCFGEKYWVFIIVFFFLFQLSGLLKNVSMVYYCRWMFVGAADLNPETTAGAYQAILAAVGGIPTGLGMILAWPLANKFGKGKAMAYGLILSALGGLVSIIAPANFYMVTAGVILKGIGSIPAMYVSLALMSDVLDHLEAKNGFRSDGFTMSVYGAIMVGLTGLAIGILNALLSASGYNAQSAIQNETVKTVLVWCYLGAELVAYSICGVMFIFMDVEKFSSLDHAAILEDQKAQVLAKGEVWVAPEERLRLDQLAADEATEQARKKELKSHCAKKGLIYEEEEAKYEKEQSAKAEKASLKAVARDAKKQTQEKARQEKEFLNEEKRQARFQARCKARGLSYENEKRKLEEKTLAKKAAKEAKEKDRQEKILNEFTTMRAKAKAAAAKS